MTSQNIPDWQLPTGVDRGLWDYFHSGEMVAGYDAQMAASALASVDVAFCESTFGTPGKLIDLGCGTGRLAVHFAQSGYTCTGVDLSHEMLAQAQVNAHQAGVSVDWHVGNLCAMPEIASESFDYAACLFSTLGMVRGAANQRAAMGEISRILKPGGQFVWHVHNRFFRGLGSGQVMKQICKTLIGSPTAGDVTMPQAYAGAPLTLHLFTLPGARKLLAAHGLQVTQTVGITVGGEIIPARSGMRAYGYLLAAEKRP
jgi:SAM-dependent methyltransferase